MGARDIIDPTHPNVLWKDKTGTKKVSLGDYSYKDDNCIVKYYYNYDPPPEELNLSMTTTELVSRVHKSFFEKRCNGIGRHGMNILNKYKHLVVKDAAPLNDQLNCVKLWEGPAEGEPDYDPNNLAPGDKYSFQTIHSSYDKRFFKEFWYKYKDHYFSRFFYDNNLLIAYSIFTKELNQEGEVIYLFGKAATHLYPGLSRFIDYYSTRDYLNESGSDQILLNWADSGKKLLEYKKSIFTDNTEKTIYYATNK